jgi:hypothetical protein
MHGFMQTGDAFRMRVGSLRKGLKSRVAFEFLDAPFVVRGARKGIGRCRWRHGRRAGSPLPLALPQP